MPTPVSTAIAALVVLGVLATTVWAAVRGDFVAEFRDIVRRPWGVQFVVDFYGLELMLALWMTTHAATAGTWLPLGLCLVLLPIFGATAAGAYWLLAVL